MNFSLRPKIRHSYKRSYKKKVYRRKGAVTLCNLSCKLSRNAIYKRSHLSYETSYFRGVTLSTVHATCLV